MPTMSQQLSQPAIKDLGEPQHLEPIFADGQEPTVDAWEGRLRPRLLERWAAVIGEPSFGDFDRAAEVIERFEAPFFNGTLIRQPTGPGLCQTLLLMEPKDTPEGRDGEAAIPPSKGGNPRGGSPDGSRSTLPCRPPCSPPWKGGRGSHRAPGAPRPGAIVPFYHPDLMAGFDLETREPKTERPNVHFGRHLVQQGYVVVCTEAFPYNTVPEPEDSAGFAWWQAGADKLLADNPNWTGIGKLIWDTSRAVDLLLEQPHVDAERIVCMGHSLGGKMAFYTAAFDERIKAAVASDFGIGWSFTNWDAPWYFGGQIRDGGFMLNGHHALALLAPRAFLAIAGEADRPESWQHINEAKRVYRLYGKEDAVGCFLHMTGHQPTDESIVAAYKWLAEQFGLPEREWSLGV